MSFLINFPETWIWISGSCRWETKGISLSQVETWQRYGICALKEDGQWDLWDVDLQTIEHQVGGLDPFFDSFLQS